jgi:hypothetical protein
MRHLEVLFGAALIGSLIGLYYATKISYPEAPKQNVTYDLLREFEEPVHGVNTLTTDHNTVDRVLNRQQDSDLKSCSRTNTMPCEVSVVDPVKEKLEAHPQAEGVFYKGEKVTCLYNGVYSWDNGNEYIKTVGMECRVTAASEVFTDIGPQYQQIKVNCSKGLEKAWSDQPGVGMVKGHKLNFVERWYTSDECYHFSGV